MAANVQRKKKIRPRDAIFYLSFMILPLIHFALFYVYVNFDAVLMGFQKTVQGEVVWTFEHFSRFFNEFSLPTSEIRLAFVNTFKTFGLNLVMFVVSFIVSYFLYRRIFGHRFFRTVFFMPSLIAGTIVASFYMKFVGIQGPIASLIAKMDGLDYIPELLGDPRYANKMVFAMLIWLSFPANMVIWGGTFSRVSTSVLESAKLDGAGWIRETFTIIVPIIWPTFALQLLLTFVGLFSASGNVFLLTRGNFETQTLSNWMYMQVYVNTVSPDTSNAFNYMSAIGLMLTAVSMAISVTVRKVNSLFDANVTY